VLMIAPPGAWPAEQFGVTQLAGGVDRYENLRIRWSVAQRAVGPDGVGVSPSPFDNDLSLSQTVEELAIGQSGPRRSCGWMARFLPFPPPAGRAEPTAAFLALMSDRERACGTEREVARVEAGLAPSASRPRGSLCGMR
jgi:hypothetical protein